MHSRPTPYRLLIVLIACLLFLPYLGSVHLFDWDEINFAECAREMILTGNYTTVQINYQSFWEKPPLFIWMQVLSMKLFGINEFAARFPNAVCGILTLLFLFNAGKKMKDEKFGLLWAGFFVCSFLPHLYFHSGIIDPWFNLFIFSSVYYLFRYQSEKKYPHLLYSAFLIGLAMLTKGPVAYLILGATCLIAAGINRFRTFLSFREMFLYGIVSIFSGSLWFILLATQGKTQVIYDFILYQVRLFSTEDSGHGGPFYYHVIVLLFGCFPASVFALGSFRKNTGSSFTLTDFTKWMKVLFWVVLILFSIVKTKIVHYSSLCYFPLTFLAAATAYRMLKENTGWIKLQTGLYITLSFFTGVILVLAGLFEKMKVAILESGILKDEFAVANLQADVHWNGTEFLAGILFILFSDIGAFFIFRRNYSRAIPIVLGASLLTITLAVYFFAPKVEMYSQHAAIGFYKEKSKENCYIETLGFKSYAQLFYGDKKIPENALTLSKDWLLNNPYDKPVYFVCKITSLKEIAVQYPDLKEVKRKNGFVLLKKGN